MGEGESRAQADACPPLPSTGLAPLWRLNCTKEQHPDGHWHGVLTPLPGHEGVSFVAVAETDVAVGVKLFHLFDEARATLPETERDAFWEAYVEVFDGVSVGPDIVQPINL